MWESITPMTPWLRMIDSTCQGTSVIYLFVLPLRWHGRTGYYVVISDKERESTILLAKYTEPYCLSPNMEQNCPLTYGWHLCFAPRPAFSISSHSESNHGTWMSIDFSNKSVHWLSQEYVSEFWMNGKWRQHMSTKPPRARLEIKTLNDQYNWSWCQGHY